MLAGWGHGVGVEWGVAGGGGGGGGGGGSEDRFIFEQVKTQTSQEISAV